jgi:hypothetical protein
MFAIGRNGDRISDIINQQFCQRDANVKNDIPIIVQSSSNQKQNTDVKDH